jgi:hypothetical protein
MSAWDEIRKKCPKLYKNDIFFECGIGWAKIIEDLSVKIEKILERDAEKYPVSKDEKSSNVEMFAVQVKEKYGTLRFYMTCANEEMIKLIEDIENMSSRICENCGEEGKLRGTRWLETRCDNCYKEKA